MRNLITLVEAANKGCPRATHDIDLNLKNRQHAIDEYHYGPANPNKPEAGGKFGPGRYWEPKSEGVAEDSGPQVGDEVYYGNRLVGWVKQ